MPLQYVRLVTWTWPSATIRARGVPPPVSATGLPHRGSGMRASPPVSACRLIGHVVTSGEARVRAPGLPHRFHLQTHRHRNPTGKDKTNSDRTAYPAELRRAV